MGGDHNRTNAKRKRVEEEKDLGGGDVTTTETGGGSTRKLIGTEKRGPTVTPVSSAAMTVTTAP